jgi:hypothetical protein
MMSGLSRYMGKTDKNERTEHRIPTPPPAQPGLSRFDRSAAQNLKFGSKKFEVTPAAAAQRLPSTAPAPGYVSNPTASRNTYPNNRFITHQPPAYQRDFDDVTVDSDFDVTKSDINFEPADENGEYQREVTMLPERQHEYAVQAEQRFSQGMPQHRLHHVHSQSPLKIQPESQQTPPKPQASGIVGRFQPSQGPSQHSDLQVRLSQPVNESKQQMASSKKRNRSNERPRENYKQQRHEGDDELEDTDEYDFPRPQIVGGRGRELTVPQNQLEIDSDEVETPATSPTRQRKTRHTDRLQSSQVTIRDTYPTPDYNDEILKGMKYSELKSENWEKDPNPKSFDLPVELQGPGIGLGERIKYYADKKDDDLALFFEQLSASEWEQAGDWLIGKFGELMQQLKEKRQEKRALTEKFEAEIEAREKAVRSKSEHLDKKFNQMRASGEDVLRGKMI